MQSYQTIPKYKTKDGKLHDTIEQANRHIENLIYTVIGDIVHNCVLNNLYPAKASLQITGELYANREKIKEVLAMENCFKNEDKED